MRIRQSSNFKRALHAGPGMRQCGTVQGAVTGESGIALIMVLGVLAVVGVMVAHLVLVSEVVAREAKVAAVRSQLKYVAESEADRAFWLLVADRAWFTSRRLGIEVPEREEGDGEVWMTDGKIHASEVMEFPVQVSLLDADTGLDISGADAAEKIRTLIMPSDEDAVEEEVEQIEEFLDVLADYTDSDDYTRLNGKEVADYETEGYPEMPRNAPMQFREEACWLEGAGNALFGGHAATLQNSANQPLRLVPPKGFAFRSKRGGKVSFFSATASLISQVAKLTDAELAEVLEARERWRNEGELLEESLSADLLGRMKNNFSFKESGIVTLEVTAFSVNHEIKRRLSLTRDCRVARHVYSDSARKRFAYWQKTFY